MGPSTQLHLDINLEKKMPETRAVPGVVTGTGCGCYEVLAPGMEGYR